MVEHGDTPVELRDELLLEEVERARSIGAILGFLCFLVLAFVPFLGGHEGAQAAMVAAMVGLGGTSLFVRYRAREPRRYTATLFRVYGAVAVATAVTIQVYLGVFSPTVLAVVLGIAFFSQGRDRVGAWVISGGAIVGTLVLASLTAAGIVPDVGIIDTSAASPLSKTFFAIVVPIVLTVTMLQGRANHLAAVALHERVARGTIAIEAGEARLGEVVAELELLRAPIGRGAHTGGIAGPFRLGEVLGRGGVGEVYLATDGTRRAAVKVLRAAWSGDEEVVRRFGRECRLAEAVESEHTVELFGHGALDDGTPWLAMEYLDGLDLAQVLRETPKLSLEDLGPLVAQVAVGLDAVHRTGIVHRDLKPRNLLRAGGTWKILDFGVARALGTEATLTAQGVVGTPNYMSPEQASSEPVDTRSDLFSLGSIVYRCLLGRAPFSGRTPLMTIYQVAETRPTRPRTVDPELPRQLEDFLAVALARERGDRFGSAQEFAQVFEAAMRGEFPDHWRRHAQQLVRRSPWS